MTISTYSLTREQLTEELNSGKENFVRAMLKDGVITQEQKEIMDNYSIVLTQKGFFGKVWDKIFKKKDVSYYFVVKIIMPVLNEEEKVEDPKDE